MQINGEQAPGVLRQIGEKAIRAAIPIIGLLLLQAICSFLPMLKYTSPVYHRSWESLALPAVPGGGLNFPIFWQQFQNGNPQPFTEAQVRFFRLISNPEGKDGHEIADALIKSVVSLHWAIFPISIVNAVIATLIFLVLVRFGSGLRRIVREGYARFPDLSELCFLGILAIMVTLAYSAYQDMIYPLLGPWEYLYGWAFLLLGLVPLAGIVMLVARKMDAISELVFHSAQIATRSLSCDGCGEQIERGAKFCPSCGAGAPSSVKPMVASKKSCPACGAKNIVTAKFCKGCGREFEAAG